MNYVLDTENGLLWAEHEPSIREDVAHLIRAVGVEKFVECIGQEHTVQVITGAATGEKK